ncbi:MAG: hypothetical protein J6T26_01125 [Firmicutes bacterium]|nr:hypothetical protein [Bacillota bacterium]
MTKEEKYREQMIALGTWNEAFKPVVHSLCVLERETSRIRDAWKKTAPPGRSPSALDPHYGVIRNNEREIAALRDALGLTPRGLRKLKGMGTSEGTGEKIETPTVLSLVRERYA